ncbi:MAG: lysylphosphatidylglycerol synthase domain-containing protein [Myxococcota bacterium]|nr:lysylphosphatidylglycerol synthase domain-containing protein [Myxococcota bacterium]
MDSSTRRAWSVRALQLLASIAVLVTLAQSADTDRVWEMLTQGMPAWLVGALLLKAASIVLHEVRLWHALPAPRPSLLAVIRIGLIAGTLNLALPARAGDLSALALLRRDCGVSVGTAGAAVGLVAFLEMAVFAVFLLGALVIGAGRWELLLGAAAHARALKLTTLGTLAAAAGAVVIVALARRLKSTPQAAAPGPVTLLREGLSAAASALSTARWLGAHLAMTAAQVALMLAAAAALFPMLRLPVPLPGLAAAGMMAGASVAGVVLPPGFGAGPAAVSVVLLAPLGITETGALAYAAGFWLLGSLPTVLLGLPALWWRDGDRLRS